MSLPKVCAVIVNYNGIDVIARCLDALGRSDDVDLQIIVVDNASTDGSDDVVEHHFPDVQLVRSGENLGFGRGNNRALPHCTSEFIAFVNPDAFVEPATLCSLVHFVSSRPRCGLVGPRLLNSDGSLQYSVRNFPSVLNQLFEALFLHRILPRATSVFGEVVRNAERYESPHPVDWVSGAVMFARREAIQETNGFDERFFLFSEETDLCARLESTGWEVWYSPEVSVEHAHGDSSRPEVYSAEVSSRMLYYAIHYPPVQRACLVALLGASLCARLLLLSVVARLGSADAARRRSAVRAGLTTVLAGRGGAA